MTWSKDYIINIVQDLADENPFACRALFKISDIVFNKTVPTLAVSIAAKPVLIINRAFLNRHAKTENDIKAVLLHEFLHVVLQHTEKFTFNTPLLNIALDAIINSIIHRTYGETYSGFFCRFYASDGIETLLRAGSTTEEWSVIHQKIYSGKFAADDLYELLQYLMSKGRIKDTDQLLFIGNHTSRRKAASAENEQLLKETLSKMEGTGIWNNPGARGTNERLNDEHIKTEQYKIKKWRSSVLKVLQKCMEEDQTKKTELVHSTVMMPVLNNSDRRALATVSWSGLIPFTKNTFTEKKAAHTVNIYLDVSGSMSQEINHIVSLLYYFRHSIKTPLWVFSNEVEKAVFKNGEIIYQSTGGTSISCVFNHIRVNRFKKNIIVTDGYTEAITDEMIKNISLQKLWVILSADSSAAKFDQHNIKYTQLKKL